MNDIVSIKIIFENCEYVEFDREEIGNFWCDNIHDVVSRIGSNSIQKYQCCDGMFIELKSSADTEYYCYGNLMDGTKFDRIVDGRDVTQIDVTYDNGIVENICLPWSDYDEEFNDAQTCYLSSYGNLYLMVSEEDEVADEIDKDEVNSQEYDLMLDAYS